MPAAPVYLRAYLPLTLTLTQTQTLTITHAQGVDVLLLEMHARFFKERWRGHRPGFSTNLSHVDHLITLLKSLPSRRQAGRCRTRVQWLATAEREHAYLSER